jgi:glutaminyl-peptide cyclotransferase
LNSYADKVIEQPFDAITYKGERLKATNIIAVFNPEAKRRILLGAHWDTRAIADHDPDPDKRNQPIPGADDGGSGVGVLLEIARNLHLLPVEIGVDIVMFDAEDQGADTGNNPESWCLGAQHWSSNPHVKGYKADFGILLDMVGSKGARFTLEGVSMQFAPDVMNRIWKMAQSMGYSGYFVSERTGPITDDHYFVNTIARIPMINIINRPKNTETGFGQYWHTHADNMDVIDKNTLRAVGQVVLAVLYRTEGGSFL